MNLENQIWMERQQRHQERREERMPASGRQERVWQMLHTSDLLSTPSLSLKQSLPNKASYWESLGTKLWNYPPSNTKYNVRRGHSSKQCLIFPHLAHSWCLVGLASDVLCDNKSKTQAISVSPYNVENWTEHPTHPNKKKSGELETS